MDFAIKPLPITQVATKLSFRIINSTDNTVTVYYELRRDDNKVVEIGNKTFPISSLAIIAATPIDITGLNALLSAWNVEAAPTETPAS